LVLKSLSWIGKSHSNSSCWVSLMFLEWICPRYCWKYDPRWPKLLLCMVYNLKILVCVMTVSKRALTSFWYAIWSLGIDFCFNPRVVLQRTRQWHWLFHQRLT
jgi:hypothetical protein